LFDAFVQKAGCTTGDLSEKMTCLRSASISALAIAQDNVTATLYVSDYCLHVSHELIFISPAYNAFHPVVDKKLLTDFPTRLIQNGVFRRVPLMIGLVNLPP